MTAFVLVIDDSPTIRTILEVGLRRAGYEVMSFEDGVQALQWLNSPQARIPDLIFLDLEMPKLDGYEVLRLLKAMPGLAQTTRVILSQHDGVLDHIKGWLAGAHHYLDKPFKLHQILVLVQAHAAGRAGQIAPTPPIAPTHR